MTSMLKPTKTLVTGMVIGVVIYAIVLPRFAPQLKAKLPI